MEGRREPPIAAVGGYDVLARLGPADACGRISTVYRGARRSDGRNVALKQVCLSGLSANLKDSLDCEIRFLASVRHPNIIRLLDVVQVNYTLLLLIYYIIIVVVVVVIIIAAATFRLNLMIYGSFGENPVLLICYILEVSLPENWEFVGNCSWNFLFIV